ncbi:MULTISPECIES: undecaprenyl-diphosphatase [unclassified Lebetimonas]|uniref:undecaprenyl-diphosphatase n=1 Tax=unclassified Lebetimonas TaxID=2648158 RepID=UPI0004632612|nr:MULTISPECIES: undecaprenyl-diphosphatase [unclassified Lebetimonas]
MGLNKEWFLDINSLAGYNHLLDEIMILSAKTTPFIFAIILIYLWFSKRKNESLFAFYSAMMGLLLNQIITLIYFHPRPFMVHIGTLLIHHKPENSFPSDHATLTFSIAFMLLMFKSTRIIGIFAFLLALLCGIARVYVGVHWPFDIIGGFFVGLISAIIIYSLKEKLQKLNDIAIFIWNKILGVKN